MALFLNGRPELKSFTLNFDQTRKGTGRDPLLRAIGSNVNTLVDMTPGWCTDALQVARQGIEVSAIERNRVVFLMIRYARSGLSDALFEGAPASVPWSIRTLVGNAGISA